MSTNTIYIAIILLTIWNIALTVTYMFQKRFFTQFTKGISKNDLKTILKNIANSLKTVDKELSTLDKAIDQINKDSKFHFQRIGFVRFNPFSDTGGDQSFCLCLLDQNNTGFIVTSFHSREQTRIYAKNIAKGKSEQSQLSKEENQALKHALDSGPKSTRNSKK